MREKTVKKHIFWSNAGMVLVTLILILLINIVFVRVYSESIEHQVAASLKGVVEGDVLKNLLEEYTIRKNEFILLFLADGIFCIGVLCFVSHFFTKKLAYDIMVPLNVLSEGTRSIRNNDLTQEIQYEGDREFEEVCVAFNDMRQSLLDERIKNQKYEKARTEMIAGISHDLRTPLTAVRGTIKGLMDGVASTPNQQSRFLETAYRRTGDMTVLLNQLFYLSKLETGNMPISFKEIPIADFISEYVSGRQELLEGEAVTVSFDANKVKDSVSVDPEQFLRILDNLVENSRKYAAVDPLEITITLEKKKESVLIRFSDNGVGIDEEKLPYIFDEFYRGDESRNIKEGSGLGLYIVKHLIEQMGGKVWAENAQGLVIYMELKIDENTDRGEDENGRKKTDIDRGR